MPTNHLAEEPRAQEIGIQKPISARAPSDLAIGLLTGCKDRPYVFGLATALASNDVCTDVIGSDDLDSPEMHNAANLHFLNFRGSQNPKASFVKNYWICWPTTPR